MTIENIFDKMKNTDVKDLINYGKNFKKQKTSQLIKYGNSFITFLNQENIKDEIKNVLVNEKYIVDNKNIDNFIRENINNKINYIYFLNVKYKPAKEKQINILENINNKLLSDNNINKTEIKEIVDEYKKYEIRNKILKSNFCFIKNNVLFLLSSGSENINVFINTNNLSERDIKDIFLNNFILYGFNYTLVEDKTITKLSETEFLERLKENKIKSIF